MGVRLSCVYYWLCFSSTKWHWLNADWYGCLVIKSLLCALCLSHYQHGLRFIFPSGCIIGVSIIRGDFLGRKMYFQRSCIMLSMRREVPCGASLKTSWVPLTLCGCCRRRLNLALVICLFELMYISFDWWICAFVVLGFVFFHTKSRYCLGNVSEMTYSVSSGA